VAIGFGNVDGALARTRIRALLNAADGAADGTRKLQAALHRRDDAGDIAVIDAFTSAQLDLALGRSNVIHAALLAGPECETFLARAARLDCFRTGAMPGSPRHPQRSNAQAGECRPAARPHDETRQNARELRLECLKRRKRAKRS
jgi:hypothetical protein